MSDVWTPMFVLPNVDLKTPIGCDIAVLAPPSDERVKALKSAHPVFGCFLDRFSDDAGNIFEPVIALLRSDANQKFLNAESQASFRDVLALCVLILHHSWNLLPNRSGRYILFGDAFAIYPWVPDSDCKYLTAYTPGFLGTRKIDNFKGHSLPAFSRLRIDAKKVDGLLLETLLRRWQEHYGSLQTEWPNIALFRSLNMAYHASLLPTVSFEMGIYDLGRQIALWISAFEILVHPGENGRANLDKVFDLFEKIRWVNPSLARKIYDTKGKQNTKRSLACFIYKQMYDCRNHFLHGNPVKEDDLLHSFSKKPLLYYAAPLYRLALSAFLPLVYNAPDDTSEEYTPEERSRDLLDKSRFRDSHSPAEEAIFTSINST